MGKEGPGLFVGVRGISFPPVPAGKEELTGVCAETGAGVACTVDAARGVACAAAVGDAAAGGGVWFTGIAVAVALGGTIFVGCGVGFGALVAVGIGVGVTCMVGVGLGIAVAVGLGIVVLVGVTPGVPVSAGRNAVETALLSA